MMMTALSLVTYSARGGRGAGRIFSSTWRPLSSLSLKSTRHKTKPQKVKKRNGGLSFLILDSCCAVQEILMEECVGDLRVSITRKKVKR
jgi:hypothetical protein